MRKAGCSISVKTLPADIQKFRFNQNLFLSSLRTPPPLDAVGSVPPGLRHGLREKGVRIVPARQGFLGTKMATLN